MIRIGRGCYCKQHAKPLAGRIVAGIRRFIGWDPKTHVAYLTEKGL